jgi:SRSO17 transposase
MTQQAPVQTLIIDDTSFAKSGAQSVGVQRQYCGSLGKVANCQVVVSLTAATSRGHLPIDMQLYVPQKWLSSPELRQKAHIPESLVFQTKPELALMLLARALRAGVPSGVVLADAAYGDNAQFRNGLGLLKLSYAVGIQLSTIVQLVGNEQEATSVQALSERIKTRPFRRYTWRQGTSKLLTARFAFFAVRIPKADSQQTLWLILERRDGSASAVRAYLSSLPRKTPRRQLVYLLKERWCTEATYRDSKQELGLDQYQGRLYPGLQHHLSSVLCTCAFIAAERARIMAHCGTAAPKMQRTAQNLQRHSPTSIATLRHLIALSVGPWLHSWLRHPPATPLPLPNHPHSTQMAGSAGR